MEDLKNVIGSNIAKLRKNYGLTQIQFAEKINYSDKSISKWERGESLPDIVVLKQIAMFFSISLDALTSEHKTDKALLSKSKKYKNRNRVFISFLSCGLVWVIATIIFAVLNWLPIEIKNSWLVFVYSLVISLLVLMIFNFIWGKNIWSAMLLSSITWTFAIALYLTISINSKWLLFIICVPIQIIIILWSLMVRKKRMHKEILQEETNNTLKVEV